MTPKYTEKIHAERVIKVLENKNTCKMCPRDRMRGNMGNMWNTSLEDACLMCVSFIGLPYREFSTERCPCNALPKSEVFKRTWLALEEKGYI